MRLFLLTSQHATNFFWLSGLQIHAYIYTVEPAYVPSAFSTSFSSIHYIYGLAFHVS